VKVRAQFDNADNALFPNQFVNAQLLVKTLHNVVTVPTAAIQRGAPGSYVYVINADNRVSVRPVNIGPTDGPRPSARRQAIVAHCQRGQLEVRRQQVR
jgi:multidrug efflux system membrane fusion protein